MYIMYLTESRLKNLFSIRFETMLYFFCTSISNKCLKRINMNKIAYKYLTSFNSLTHFFN